MEASAKKQNKRRTNLPNKFLLLISDNSLIWKTNLGVIATNQLEGAS